MTKNPVFFQFQCNQSPVRARGLFLAKGYRGYTEILNFPLLNFIFFKPPFLCFSILQSLCILCSLCNFNCLAQAQTGLHWNFFLCNLKPKNTLLPKPSNGYTDIEPLCNLTIN